MKQNSKGIFDYLKLEIIGFYLTGQRLNLLICPTVFSTIRNLTFTFFGSLLAFLPAVKIDFQASFLRYYDF